ncbi:hypothetical protein KEM60_00290 [Austwickia sp. TVS 96-490-7B]|uniref:hypothetical protein n=1 Tax=Austwickia sp. TVS 96-490-7B TaxID=2830843 RepID=UPI001C59AA8D|nr:hypothetical protein [Austwickia sp. TVS 96-490-7B]MBW3084107.1 hypothetical protein [Austwickia sp. TVS 96-490-7B]
MTSRSLHPVLDASHDMEIAVPPDWDVLDPATVGPAVTCAVVAPIEPDLEFRPNVILTRSDIDRLSVAEWQEHNETVLRDTLTAYTVVDRYEEFADYVVTDRRLADYVTPDGVNVTMTQWSRARAGRGVTLTVTVSTADFPEMVPLVEAIGATWRWVDQA